MIIAGRFAIQNLETDLLGQGGMGKVYRGQDIQTGAAVAIKHLKPELTAYSSEMIERFSREGEALRQLNHPNIVKLLATAEEAGQYYLVIRKTNDKQSRLSLQRNEYHSNPGLDLRGDVYIRGCPGLYPRPD